MRWRGCAKLRWRFRKRAEFRGRFGQRAKSGRGFRKGKVLAVLAVLEHRWRWRHREVKVVVGLRHFHRGESLVVDPAKLVVHLHVVAAPVRVAVRSVGSGTGSIRFRLGSFDRSSLRFGVHLGLVLSLRFGYGGIVGMLVRLDAALLVEDLRVRSSVTIAAKTNCEQTHLFDAPQRLGALLERLSHGAQEAFRVSDRDVGCEVCVRVFDVLADPLGQLVALRVRVFVVSF